MEATARTVVVRVDTKKHTYAIATGGAFGPGYHVEIDGRPEATRPDLPAAHAYLDAIIARDNARAPAT